MKAPSLPVNSLPWPVRFAVLGGWLLFILMVISVTWVGSFLQGRPFSFTNTIVWNSGWLFWAVMTFVAAAGARRFPLERKHLVRGIARHAGLGVVLAAAILGLEFMLNSALTRLWPENVRPNALVGYFTYRFHIHFLVYWMVVGATQAYDYYARLRASEVLASQLEARLAQAQLQALKMQLHPHFLFNTHHSIISLMLKPDNPAAIKMLTRLSDLLRITLKHTERQVTSLREEQEALELYLGIQQERYRERLVVRLEFEPSVLDAEIPCLLLQPLVENALQHGIDTLAGGGVLTVKARHAGDCLELEVADNGPGVPAGFSLEEECGIGLRNTKARLERLYGPDHRLEVRRAAAGGTEVIVAFPFRAAQAEDGESETGACAIVLPAGTASHG